MKTFNINSQQLEAVLQKLMELNIPVKDYKAIQDLFNNLPAVAEAEKVSSDVETNDKEKTGN